MIIRKQTQQTHLEAEDVIGRFISVKISNRHLINVGIFRLANKKLTGLAKMRKIYKRRTPPTWRHILCEVVALEGSNKLVLAYKGYRFKVVNDTLDCPFRRRPRKEWKRASRTFILPVK